MRVIAVDWSGARSGAERKIWLAEADASGLVRLECGRSREETITHIIECARSDAHLAVGLDFAFSMPEWWLDAQGLASALDLWQWLGAGNAERLLAECAPPFWGRRGTTMCRDRDLMRATDATAIAGIATRPKSVFQIAGAGAVGTGSLRGMPLLADLHDAGFSIWPFDGPRLPIVIEVYPRACTGPVVKSSASARAADVATHASALPSAMRDACLRSEDAFDACFSALAMWEHRHDLLALPAVNDPRRSREGIIWHPAWRR